MHSIIEVALPTGSLNQTFHYLTEIPENQIIIGRRVLVPFGSRALTGVALGIGENTENYELKFIIKWIDDKPIFDAPMMRLLLWVANYYICPIGEVFRAALPPNISPKSVSALEFCFMPHQIELERMIRKAPRRAEILKYLATQKKPVKITTLQNRLGFKINNSQITELVEKAYVRYTKNIDIKTKPQTATALKINEKLTEPEIVKISSLLERKAPKQYAIILELVNNAGLLLQSIALETTNSSIAAVNALVKKEIIEKIKVPVDRSTQHSGGLAHRNEAKLTLTEEQKDVLQQVNTAIDENKFQPFLLHGVTGSGKTLIYIHAIANAVKQGKSALLLVPEIALTPQLLDRFEQVFPNKIVAIHSKLSDGQRLDAWTSILAGEKSIVIGARSALFAPLQNLGLVIIDEEHELSYKQSSPQPRYQGRDTALMRALCEDAVCLLGSATPAFESMYNVETGKYKLLEIKQRAEGAVMPDVQIIDMLDAKRSGNCLGAFSVTLINEIMIKLRKKEGIIIFLNRRGYAPFLECQNCAHIPTCTHCDVTLTLHKKNKQLRCHYCGHTEPVPIKCPECGGELKEVGFGTQRIEEELAELLNENGLQPVIQRIDLDSTTRKGAFRKILTDFSEGKTDILIGTQMVAKGLDFKRCTLVGVINADLQLFIEDFRSSERTFQLLTQVSGRAGRSRDKGSVIIQTNHPDNPAVAFAKNADYKAFYDLEIKARQQTQFPPFSRFCVIEFSGKDYHNVQKAAQYIYHNMPQDESIITFPPLEPYLARVKDTFRILLPLKSIKERDHSGKKLRQAIKTVLYQLNNNEKNKVDIKIDIDSYSVM